MLDPGETKLNKYRLYAKRIQLRGVDTHIEV